MSKPFITCMRKNKKTGETDLWFNEEHPMYLALSARAEEQGKTFGELFHDVIERGIRIDHEEMTGTPLPGYAPLLPQTVSVVLVKRRCEEIEKAADLEPGSVMNSVLEYAEQWWTDADSDALENHILTGWECKHAPAIRRALRLLRNKWREEDRMAAARPLPRESQ